MSKDLSFQVLLSAMHLDDYKYIDKLHIKGNAVVINQCDLDEGLKISSAEDELGREVRFISTTQRGLSKSRNMAIREAEADICIFCDNDVVYEDDYIEQICGEFEKNPTADIIVFFIKRPERGVPVFSHTRELGYDGAMRIFSPEIAFRRESLIKSGLLMNESFGAGARYAMGEENIFLFEAIGKGLNCLYCPTMIAQLMDTQSTWFKGYTDKFFMDRGANYYAMTRRWYWFLILQFAVRKLKLYSADNSVFNAVRCMFDGAKEYRKECESS